MDMPHDYSRMPCSPEEFLRKQRGIRACDPFGWAGAHGIFMPRRFRPWPPNGLLRAEVHGLSNASATRPSASQQARLPQASLQPAGKAKLPSSSRLEDKRLWKSERLGIYMHLCRVYHTMNGSRPPSQLGNRRVGRCAKGMALATSRARKEVSLKWASCGILNLIWLHTERVLPAALRGENPRKSALESLALRRSSVFH